MPISAYVGSRELMGAFEKMVVSSTYAGETLSLAAAKVAIDTYRTQGVVAHLWKQGEAIRVGINDLARKHNLKLHIGGYGPVPFWSFIDGALREPVLRAAYRHGVSLYEYSYPNFSHQDVDIAEALARLDRAFGEVVAGGI